ncbi:ABC transporter substrate-binding protein [Moraxella sp. FZLJ2107]|uniref:ABC transporter substrate-binding protein n=1 Tax=unclassified Moraxella TaxID=2685852 RepID=UPI0020C8CF99|nr:MULTISPECIES: ABC transporter substrate-binding protein [unclassified Moraxella]UTO06029.1 ABC transporter substrate-binding protein [Moraxella sp. FZLJ2107]UTO22766.1 ABC transporter substrate-binding protein [Moraxella sp. FZLJ2109]
MKPSSLSLRLLGVLGLCTLSACGTSQTDAPAAVHSKPTDPKALIINNGAEPESLDPHKVSGVPESNILRQLLVGLVSTDDQGNTIGGMATSWTTTDNKVWTFTLNDDAKWSNGDAVTAHDFVYSFRRLTDPATASPYASYLVDAKVINAQAIMDGTASPESLGITAIDNRTLQISLSEPVPYFVDMLIHTATLPVHQKTIETFGDKWTTPEHFVGNGAYRLSAWQVNERIVLERNPIYFDTQNVAIDKVTFLAIPQASTDVQRYRAGEIDISNEGLPPEQYAKLKQDLGAEVVEPPKLCTYYYEFNHTKPPFDNTDVRKALALTLDREIITDSILKQGQTPAYQFSPTTIGGITPFEPTWKAMSKDERIAEAKRLLAQAGYSKGHPLKFELLYNTNEQHKTLAVAAAALWKENLGFVEVNLNNQEWKTYLETRRKQNYQMARGGWCADYNEASSFLNTFKSDNSNNYGKYSSAAFDNIMNSTLGNTIDTKARAELYRQAEAQLDHDTATIFVYHYTAPRLVKSYVQGFPIHDPLGNWQVKNLSIRAD